jgi:hypothetical protein
MDTATRARTGVAVALGLATCATVGLALSVVHGFAVEYGGGSFASLGLLVVAPPVLLASLAVLALPRTSTRVRVAVVLGTVVAMVAGGLAADALGSDANRDRLLRESRDFSCNGPNAEVRVPAEVDRTWRELPRLAPVYGPIEGSASHCVAGVAGDGHETFAAYTEAFRTLAGWRGRADHPHRYVMVRDGVRVTVLLRGAPDRLTTIGVSLRGGHRGGHASK